MDQGKVVEAIIAGTFLVVVAIITAFFTSRTNKKNVFINTVTGERAKWRDELRKDTAEFCRLAYEEAHKKDGTNKPRLRELKALIRLRLNPNPEHKLDKRATCARGQTSPAQAPSSRNPCGISNFQILAEQRRGFQSF